MGQLPGHPEFIQGRWTENGVPLWYMFWTTTSIALGPSEVLPKLAFGAQSQFRATVLRLEPEPRPHGVSPHGLGAVGDLDHLDRRLSLRQRPQGFVNRGQGGAHR